MSAAQQTQGTYQKKIIFLSIRMIDLLG